MATEQTKEKTQTAGRNGKAEKGKAKGLTAPVAEATARAQKTAADVANMAQETAVDVTDRAKKVASDAQAEAKGAASTMVGAVHKVLLAGVGAVALSKDEIEDFVAKLVERGEIAEQEGRQLLKDVLSRRREDASKVQAEVQAEVEEQMDRAETAVDQRIEGILTRLNVPSKGDIDNLSNKIAELAEKVDALKTS